MYLIQTGAHEWLVTLGAFRSEEDARAFVVLYNTPILRAKWAATPEQRARYWNFPEEAWIETVPWLEGAVGVVADLSRVMAP